LIDVAIVAGAGFAARVVVLVPGYGYSCAHVYEWLCEVFD